jgi:hypothetical protein
MLHVEKYEPNDFQNADCSFLPCEFPETWNYVSTSCSVPQSDSIRRFHTADARLLDRHVHEKHRYSHRPADATASARYQKLISEGNFITKNKAVRYQLYVIGTSQADD